MSQEIIALDKPNYEPLGAHLLVQAIQVDPSKFENRIIGLDNKPLIESARAYERVFIVGIGTEVKKMDGYNDIELFDEVILPYTYKFVENHDGTSKIEWYPIPQQEVYDPIARATFMLINFTDALVRRKLNSKLSKFKNQ